MTEFRQLSADLDQCAADLARLEEAHGGDATALVEGANRLEPTLKHLEERLHGVFRRRALESDPEKAVYGPSMQRKVLDACAVLDTLLQRWERLGAAVSSARERLREEHEREAEALAAAAAEVAEQEARAARERAEAEAAGLRAREERKDSDQSRHQSRTVADIVAAARASLPSEGRGVPERLRTVFRGPPIALDTAVRQLRSGATEDAVGDTMQIITMLVANVHSFPEEHHFRTLRLDNSLIQTRVLGLNGGAEVLHAVGFKLREEESGSGPVLRMEEPSVEVDIEAWAAWYSSLKANLTLLRSHLSSLGVRELPLATKGGVYEPAEEKAKARGPQVAILHGSSGAA